MIEKFIQKFETKRAELLQQFSKEHPSNYEQVLKILLVALADGESEYDFPDPERIHTIDDGHYQGTLVFVIACGGYQPSDYWATTVSYGSCSGCDTLEGIRQYDDGPPTEEQAKEYLTLAIHLLQRLKEI